MSQAIRVVTAKQMKQIEKNAAEAGLSYYQMMENAGTQATNFIKDNISEPMEGKKVVIFCGKGNNGGDGFVVARLLQQMQAKLMVILVDGEPTTEDAAKNYEIFKNQNGFIVSIDELGDESFALIQDAEAVVDAIYGTGFHGVLAQNARKAATLMNESQGLKFALDIPSGVNGDSGESDFGAVKADFTIAFDSFKHAHFKESAKKYCGQVTCVSIGIEEVCHCLF